VNSGESAWEYSINFERMKDVVRICENLGFDSVWSPDHLMTGREFQGFEAWTLLAGLSQVTEKMRLGSLMTCVTHRAPSILAKMLATLDVMSNGRVELGIGAGWCGYEQLAYNLPWEDAPKARIDRLIEGIQIIKGMWTNESFTFKGKYYSVNGAVCSPKPVQKPTPPIIIGGKGEKILLKVVAKYANGWNIDEMTLEDYAHKLDVLRKHCKTQGTDYDQIEKTLETYVLISPKPEQHKILVDWTNGRYHAEKSAIIGEMKRSGVKARTATLDDIKREYIFGSVEQVIERFSQYIDIGVQRFMIYFMDYPTLNSIVPFAKQVVPSLK
jgi:F420-dependent oxidoreductase-like protein